jgi:ribosomal protein S18 acetylase RimI-like enzyme
MRMGLNASNKMGSVFKPITEDRHEYMAERTFLYLLIVGVATKMQGKGFGRKLISAAIDKSEREKLQLYLETETEGYVEMYEHFGFRLLKRISLPIVDLPMWEMVRKPTA